MLRGSRSAERELAVVIAERIGADPEGLYPQLVAAATGMAVGIAIEQWLRADPPVALTRLLHKAVAQTTRLAEPLARARRTPARARTGGASKVGSSKRSREEKRS
jgi:hypothetical protein